MRRASRSRGFLRLVPSSQSGAQYFLLGKSVACDSSCDPSCVENQHAVAEMDKFWDFGGVKQHRAANLGIGANEAVELVLRADVDAARRIEQQQDAAFGEEPLGDRNLLLIAAGEGADVCPQRSTIDFDPFEDSLYGLGLASAVDQEAIGVP